MHFGLITLWELLNVRMRLWNTRACIRLLLANRARALAMDSFLPLLFAPSAFDECHARPGQVVVVTMMPCMAKWGGEGEVTCTDLSASVCLCPGLD